MKAVILAAGRGERLGSVTEPDFINKCMLKLNGRHLIEYNLETASLAGAEEIIVVVGHRAEDIINTYGIRHDDLKIKYVFQEEQRGLVHAVEQTREALEGDDFMLLLGDEILLNPNPADMVRKFEDEDLFAVCGVVRVTDMEEIKKTYSVIYNPDNNAIYRLIEKPRNPINNIMGTGNCIFRNRIFDYIPYTPINYFRQEKELPDLVQCAIDDGQHVQLFFVGARYVNINTPDDILQAEKLIHEK